MVISKFVVESGSVKAKETKPRMNIVLYVLICKNKHKLFALKGKTSKHT